jgi:hypothetical protein
MSTFRQGLAYVTAASSTPRGRKICDRVMVEVFVFTVKALALVIERNKVSSGFLVAIYHYNS